MTDPRDTSPTEVPSTLDVAVNARRVEQARALERWAESVNQEDLRPLDTSTLQRISELADRRTRIDTELECAVGAARDESISWSMIGLMLGVSKQAAQQKYSKATRA